MIVVNYFGPPGSGKSSMATGLFSRLKFLNVSCEITNEYAKDLTWEDRHVALANQWLVSSTQLHRMRRLENKVDFIINDSPLLLGVIYYQGTNPYFKDAFLHEFNQYSNINYYIDRVKPYHQAGRFHSEKESEELGVSLKAFLKENDIPYTTIPGRESELDSMVERILKEN